MEKKTIVCLIGSINSLVGWAEDEHHNNSIDYYMLKFMDRAAGNSEYPIDLDGDLHRSFMQAVDMVRLEVNNNPNEPREVEFVAKTIARYSSDHRKTFYRTPDRLNVGPKDGDVEFSDEEVQEMSGLTLLVGSPLYVALE